MKVDQQFNPNLLEDACFKNVLFYAYAPYNVYYAYGTARACHVNQCKFTGT